MSKLTTIYIGRNGDMSADDLRWLLSLVVAENEADMGERPAVGYVELSRALLDPSPASRAQRMETLLDATLMEVERNERTTEEER